ncbi:cation channel family protein (macronuclear) [Tetrahymena thermophila SB210]|uniref:Cation channel family protein n=1 Tax=Tetrahymena thermophila (strain SB210) TaxID=312017 RepID=Q22TN3_TETTS|nr:cation channel family protein [Tetrahymena thermophila SB210]EAR88405.2 cation channel family protein [Tetrahymena thermophila SB210]|eukprot:XP_001008650.2 cation channel family protein [Tetrahymena thermophila SB210]
MEPKFEDTFERGDQKQSTLLINSLIDEQRDLQLNEIQVDRSRQRHLFEQQNYLLHQSHHGDTEIQESSIQDRTSSTILELKPQSSGEVTLQVSIIHDIKQPSKINRDINDEVRCNVELNDERELQYYQSQKTENQIAIMAGCDQNSQQKYLFNIDSNEQQSLCDLNKQSAFGPSYLGNHRENQTQIANSIILPQNSIKPVLNDKIWLQEDIFYEKNYKKFGTKVSVALKSQYIGQQLNNSTYKYKQNFEKATDIVNRLLNSSMSRVMKIRQHVQNFVNLLKLRHLNRRIDDLKENEFKIINDQSYYYQKNDKQVHNYSTLLIFNCLLRLKKMVPIFMPTNVLRVLWDMIQLISQSIQTQPYLAKITQSQNANRFLKNQKHIIKLINQIASVMTAAHIAAIGWYFLGIQENQNNHSNWLVKLGIQDHAYYEKYVYSIYWSITTMTTVGYGDIAATNYIEALYISVAMLFFSCVFAYSINNIGFILQEIEKTSKQLNDDITIIQRKDVNIQLKSRVRHYLSFLAHEQGDRDKKAEDQILSVLSNKLREEITIEINSKILNTYFLLGSNFSQATLSKVIFIMEEVLVNPNEVIVREKEYDDQAIYFIQNGTIEIYQQQIYNQNRVSVIKVLGDGQIFGELSFFSGLKRQASARSVNLSTIYKISRIKFIEILKENIEDFERFKMMQDQIIFQNDLSVIYTECYSCKNIGHIANQCPKTHRIKDQQLTVLKQNYSIFQERVQIERKNKKLKLLDKYQIKKNKEIFNSLKQNLKQQNDQCYLLFETNENFLTSENSESKFLNDDEDEDEEDQSLFESKFYFDEQSTHSKNFSKAFLRKKTEKLLKSIIKANNFYQQTSYGNESLANLENQCHSNKSLHNQESTEQKRAASNTQCAYTKTQSFDAIENINNNSIKQESSLNTISTKNAQINEHKMIYKSDLDYLNQNFEIYNQQKNQEEEEESLAKQKSIQPTVSFLNVPQTDSEFKQLKSGQHANKLYQQQTDDQNQIQKQDSQIQQLNFADSSIKPYSKQSKSRQTLSQKSLKLLNQSQREFRCSVDQILLQNFIANGLIGDQKNLLQKYNNSNRSSFLQDMFEKYQNKSEKSIKDNKEKMQSQKSIQSQILFYNSNSKDQRQSLHRNKQESQQNQQKNQNNNNPTTEVEFIKQLSKMIQKTNLPLLLQLTNSRSQFKAESSPLLNNMDQFDKIQSFKKYFPHNNFQKVILKQKKIQHEQKRQKKNKLAGRHRRQNIGLTNNLRLSTLIGSPNLIKIIPQDYDINLYKPTYLSYGVKMQNGIKFPINLQSYSNK